MNRIRPGTPESVPTSWPATSPPGWSRSPRSARPPSWSPASAAPSWSVASRCCGCCPGWPACCACRAARRGAVLPGRRGDGPAPGAGRRWSCSRWPGAPTAGRLAGAHPVLHRLFFGDWSVAWCWPPPSRCSPSSSSRRQGAAAGHDDLRGANVAIAAEEAAFLPVYLALLPFGSGGTVCSCPRWSGPTCGRRGDRRPAAPGAASCAAGAARTRGWAGGLPVRLRGQLGGMLSLVNLRLDVAILGALAGPGGARRVRRRQQVRRAAPAARPGRDLRAVSRVRPLDRAGGAGPVRRKLLPPRPG